MCDIATAALVIGSGLQVHGQNSAQRRNINAQTQQMDFANARQAQEFNAAMNAQRQRFGAEQTQGSQRIAAMEANRARAVGLDQQRAELVNQRMAAIEKAFAEESAARDVATSPITSIGDAEANEQTISGKEAGLKAVIDESEAAGEQDVGVSKEFGRVSKDYSDMAADRKQSNISEAKTRAERIATGLGIAQIQRDNAKNIADTGFNANVLRDKSSRDLTFSQQANNLRSQGLDRQAQLNSLMFDLENARTESAYDLAVRQSEIDNALAPDPIRIIDPGGRNAQIAAAFGSMLTGLAGSGAMSNLKFPSFGGGFAPGAAGGTAGGAGIASRGFM